MENGKFSQVEVGAYFMWDNWLHKKINDDTFIARGYTCANKMESSNTDVVILDSALSDSLCCIGVRKRIFSEYKNVS
jgi:hypothetical protein